ncbi:MAG UNVERIFIED_CONTAM: hypothetical protein LVR18_39975 [Planctomycetaceae bacterium]
MHRLRRLRPISPKYSPFFGSSDSPVFTTVVKKTLPPQTTGDDQPRPGKSRFHATFSVADQTSGKPLPNATPAAPGPRNCGHTDASLSLCRQQTATQYQTTISQSRSQIHHNSPHAPPSQPASVLKPESTKAGATVRAPATATDRYTTTDAIPPTAVHCPLAFLFAASRETNCLQVTRGLPSAARQTEHRTHFLPSPP